MAKKPTKIDYKNKRCPKCGSPVDIMETCVKCGRKWTEELDKDPQGKIIEPAIGLDEGKQYESIIKKIGKRKPRKSRFQKSTDELKGKKFKTFSDALPNQFRHWEIRDSDSETEIIQKRSLMRLDSRRIYNQMGLSVRAQESSKAALVWLVKMWEFLETEEQAALEPTLRSLKLAFESLSVVRQAKIAQATKMEKAMEKAHQQARKARIKAAERASKDASKMPPPDSDSEGLGLMPVALDPTELLLQATESLLKREKEKDATKDKKRKETNNPFAV